MSRGLAPLALAQLAAWETVARDAAVCFASRENGTHLVCLYCDMTILPIDRSNMAYMLNVNIILAAIVGHLRNVHRELDPDGREDKTPAIGAGIGSAIHGRGVDTG